MDEWSYVDDDHLTEPLMAVVPRRGGKGEQALLDAGEHSSSERQDETLSG